MKSEKRYHRVDPDHEVVECQQCSVWTYRHTADDHCPHCDNGNKATWNLIQPDQVAVYNTLFDSIEQQYDREVLHNRRIALAVAAGIVLLIVTAIWQSTLDVSGKWLGSLVAAVVLLPTAKEFIYNSSIFSNWAYSNKCVAFANMGLCFMSHLNPIATDLSRALAVDRKIAGLVASIDAIRREANSSGCILFGIVIALGLAALLAGGSYYYFVWRVNNQYGNAILAVKQEHNRLLEEASSRMRQIRLDDVVLGSQAINQLGDALSRVDISHCPPHFQVEYLDLVNKWRTLGQVLADNTGLKGMMVLFNDWTKLLNLLALGSVERNDINIQYRRLDAISHQYGVQFVESRR